jgi:transforming growth factor-beta-induced protein
MLPTRSPTPRPTNRPTREVAPTSYPTAIEEQTIADDVVSDPNYSTLEAALRQASLLSTLNGTNDLTLFAPNNEAFDRMDDAFIERLLQNEGFSIHLVQLLLYHVAAGQYLSTDLFEGRQIVTLSLGELLVVYRDDQLIFLNTSAVIQNLQGATPSQIVTPNRITTNGVIHEVSRVLQPDFAFQSIVDVLQSEDPRFRTFLSLITLSGLDQELRTETRMLLVPSEDSLANLSPETLDYLRDPANIAVLRQVIRNHMSETVLTSLQLQNTDTITTVDGNILNVRPVFNDNNVLENIFVDDKEITDFNLLANNGIIHVIDGLILPDSVPQ